MRAPLPLVRFLLVSASSVLFFTSMLPRAFAANNGMQAQIPPAQYQALVDLYHSTDGPHWKNQSGWLDPMAPSWFGVTVSGVQYDGDGNVIAAGFVQSLDLGNNLLNGPLPSSLGNLTGLQRIALSLNRINGVLPSSIGNLTDLETLFLPANLLSGPLPSSLGNLARLKTIDIYNNLVTGSIPSSLGNLANLESLDLAGNPLTGTIPSSLGNLAKLQYLTLHYADLSGTIPASLGNLVSVRDLSLYENNLTGSLPSSLANLPNARRLFLAANDLSGTIPSVFGNMVGLELLDLGGNQLTGSIPSSLGNLPNLFLLGVDNNQLSGDVPDLTMKMGGPENTFRLTNNFINVNSSASQASIQSMEGRGIKVFYQPQSSSPTPSPSPRARLLNISTRIEVLDGDKAAIAGFIVVGGDRWKRLAVRGLGPSTEIDGAVTDPMVELHRGYGGIIATNDNWKIRDATGTSQQADVETTGLAPAATVEATVLATVAAPHASDPAYGTPTAFTGILRGRDGGNGIGLIEVYDVDQSPDSQLANLSTRGFVGTSDNLMIGGFVIGGGAGPVTALIRGIGPTLKNFGLTGVLADPVLELRNNSGTVIASNDEWQSAQAQQITDAGLAPADDHESALIADVAPGSYTALLRGHNNTTGIALLEIYNLDASKAP